MFRIEGTYETATCFATSIEDEAIEQVRAMCNQPFTEDAHVRIMPDAHAGELVLIPLNMRDGSVLAHGKGNPDWNFSAPHGAGRVMSRTKAKERLSLEEYRAQMAGVYTTSVSAATLDEAPGAYKSADDILGPIADAVDIVEVLHPIYNFKTS